jgi:hypothetical protein
VIVSGAATLKTGQVRLMARSSTTWQPGQSGNIKGPPARPLAEILRRVGGRKNKENHKPNRQILGELMWQLATEGRVTFPDGTYIDAEKIPEWFDAAKFIFSHIDGPPPSQHDLNLSGSITLLADTEWRTVKTQDDSQS